MPARPQTGAVHPVLRRQADRNLGLFTAADARRAGYEHSEIRALRSTGRWVALRRGVYTTAEDLAEADRNGRRFRVDCLAVLLGLDRPSAVVSHASAARLRGLPVRRDPATPIRLTDPIQWRRGQGYLMSAAALPAADVDSAGPIRLTSVARTLIDCAREWPLDAAVVAMDAALLAGMTTATALEEAVAGAHHWPGAPRATRAVAWADGRAESPLETRGRLHILGSGFPPPELQVEIRSATGLVGVVDAWFDGPAVAIEFDGRVKYTDPWRGRSPERVLWEEKRREDELRALDIRVVRIADADLGPNWPSTELRLGALLAEPGPARRRFTSTPRARGLIRTG
jgi:hypothetical protein